MFGRQISTLVDLKAIVAAREEESETLEFKRDFTDSGSDFSQRIALRVAQFANADGGHIIYGVGERANRAASLDALTYPGGAHGVQKRIGQALRDWVEPELDPQFVSITERGGEYLVVYVPPSVAPVGVYERRKTKNEPLLIEFPIRTGRDMRRMTPNEVIARASATQREKKFRLTSFFEARISTKHRPSVLELHYSSPRSGAFGYSTKEWLHFAEVVGVSNFGFDIMLEDRGTGHSTRINVPFEWLESVWRASDGRTGVYVRASLEEGRGFPRRFVPVA